MHARELVEVAGLAASQGPALILGPGRLPQRGIEDYWSSSKCRLGRWARSLKLYRKALDGDADRNRNGPEKERVSQAAWRATQPVLEEIFTGDILSRLWTTVLCAHDQRRGACDAGPIARSVMLGHLEARQRALALSSDRRYIGAEAAAQLRRVRRSSERWSDYLLGALADVSDISEFAFDAERARDFSERLRDRPVAPGQTPAWTLALGSLRAGFAKALCPYSPNGDVNARIAASVLCCFSAEQFESTVLFRSLWLVRLDNTARDVESMVDDLLHADDRNRPVMLVSNPNRLPDG